MTAYTNTRDNSVLPGTGYKDGDTLTTVNGSKWIWQNESWFPVAFAGNPDVQPLTVQRNSSGGVEFLDRSGNAGIGTLSNADGTDSYAVYNSAAIHEHHLSRIRRGKGGIIGTAGKPVIAIRIDHGLDMFFSDFFPAMEARGIPVGVGVVAGAVGNPGDVYEPTATTWTDLLGYVRRGVEVWAHSLTHRDPAITGNSIYDEVVTAKNMILAAGIEPQGSHRGGITPTITPHYSTNFVAPQSWSYSYGNLMYQNYGLLELEADFGGAYRFLPTNGEPNLTRVTLEGLTLAQAKAAVDNCINYKVGACLMIHPEFYRGDTRSFKIADWPLLMDYLVGLRDSGQLELLTPSGLHFADPERSRRLNCVYDHDFATGLVPGAGSRWTRSAGNPPVTIEVESGKNYLHFPTEAGLGYISQGNGLVKQLMLHGTTMELVAKVKATATPGSVRLTVQGSDAAKLNLVRDVPIPAGEGWHYIRSIFTVPVDSTAVACRIGRATTGSFTFGLQEVFLRPV